MERTTSQGSLRVSPLERSVAVWQRVVLAPVARLLPAWISPNALSFSRLAGAGVLALLWWTGQPGWALGVYLLALGTDALDGAVARLRGQTSRFGARFDPTADKVLHGVLFLIFFSAAPVLLGTLLLLDLALLVLGLLLVLRQEGDVSASAYGKWKLALQAAACLALFWNLLLPRVTLPLPVIRGLLSLALVFAVLSVFGYAGRFAPQRARPGA